MLLNGSGLEHGWISNGAWNYAEGNSTENNCNLLCEPDYGKGKWKCAYLTFSTIRISESLTYPKLLFTMLFTSSRRTVLAIDLPMSVFIASRSIWISTAVVSVHSFSTKHEINLFFHFSTTQQWVETACDVTTLRWMFYVVLISWIVLGSDWAMSTMEDGNFSTSIPTLSNRYTSTEYFSYWNL